MKHAKDYTVKPEIDLVYMWVDGSDEEWMAKKMLFMGEKTNLNKEATTKARNADNNELIYSLRSAEKYVPWIRKIFIVTDEQKPKWLDLQNSRIKIVDIRELIPPEALPCYNSVVIEHFLYRIPGLSEHFLYANDDMFFNAEIAPDFFFTDEGLPIVRLKRTYTNKLINNCKKVLKIHSNIYRKTIENAALLVDEKFGKYYSGIPHHNIDSYLKSDYKLVSEEVLHKEINSTISNHLRSDNDIQRIIYLYYTLAVEKGKIRFVNRRESCRIRLHKPDFMYFIKKYNPALFCLNDSHHATNADRSRVEPFLESLFPDKSSFEL
ncbi:MAG: Stealth CR1 domain-containing protein [Candidatus Pacebacteria bacterium]|nr:Stealth CR1 domain-containing protein [Fermentimonas sp.]MDD3919479.1 Stealth CR1 domain-containing protein [Candidatus Paceibacterota bacterium]